MEDSGKRPYAAAMLEELIVMSSLRYDRAEVRQQIEKLQGKDMFSKDLFTETWLYKDGVKAGRKEGKAHGKAEGKRESLQLVVSARFPDFGPLPEIEDIDRPETLDQLLLAVVNAKTEDDVRIGV